MVLGRIRALPGGSGPNRTLHLSLAVRQDLRPWAADDAELVVPLELGSDARLALDAVPLAPHSDPADVARVLRVAVVLVGPLAGHVLLGSGELRPVNKVD
jgi:hypothetical protein